MFDERLSSWRRVIQNSAKKSLFFLPFSDMRTWELEAYKDHSPKLTYGNSSEGSRRNTTDVTQARHFPNSKTKAWLRKMEFPKITPWLRIKEALECQLKCFPSGTIFEIIHREFRSEACFSDSVAMKAWCLHGVKFCRIPGGRIDRIWGLDEWDGSEWWRSWWWLLIFTIPAFQSIFLENLSLYFA